MVCEGGGKEKGLGHLNNVVIWFLPRPDQEGLKRDAKFSVC